MFLKHSTTSLQQLKHSQPEDCREGRGLQIITELFKLILIIN